MGIQCQCNCKKNETIKEESKTTIYETEDIKNTQYTILNEKLIIEGKKICKFINYQYRRIYYKMKYNKQLCKLKDHFTNEINNIPKNKEYYVNILNKKIKEFFENKRKLLNNIFEEEEYFSDLNDFDNLKNMIKQNYANDIYNNKINFYNEFIEYVKKKKDLKILLKTKTLNENKKEKETKFKSSVKKVMTYKKVIDFKKVTLSDYQINFIQNDIENIYNLCFSTPNDKLPKKIDDIQNINKSFFLMLLADEFQLNTKTFVSGKLRIFIKLFYYIYIMKKYNFISSTDNVYYKIIKDDFNEVLFNENSFMEDKIISIPHEKKGIIINHLFNQSKRKSKINNSEKSIELNNSMRSLNNQLNINNSINYDINSNRYKNSNNEISIYKSSYMNNNNPITTIKKRGIISTISIHHPKKTENINSSNKILPIKLNDDDEIIYNFEQENENDNDSNNSYNRSVNKTLTKVQIKPKISKKSSINKYEKKNTKFIPYKQQLNINKDDKKRILFRKNSRQKTHKNLLESNNNIDLIKKLINDNNKKIEIYKGEYDNSLYLYAGLGTLIKPKHSSLYNGTFRYGKKEGIGIYYRQYSTEHFKYYMGEFTNNKFDGYGILIEFNYKYLKIQKGNFYNSHFISGTLFIFNERIIENHLEITKFEGELETNISNLIIYKNFGHLLKLSYNFNKKKNIYELEKEYDYTGHFLSGKEGGKGFLRHILKKEGYSYEYKGNFMNGEINGYGIIEYSDNFFIKKYEGFFKNSKTFDKYGIVYFKSGDVYEGFFDEKNLKSICGLYWYNNNNENYTYHLGIDNFFGEFRDDKKNGFGRYVSYNDNMKQVLFGNYFRGDKNGLFILIHNEEDENLKEEKKKKIKVNDITNVANHIFTGIPIDNKYQYFKQRKKYLYFENGIVMERSDNLILP